MPDPNLANVLSHIAAGKMVVLVGQSGVGDVMMAAEKVTPEAVNFMARNARGIVSAVLPEKRLRELGIPLLPIRQADPWQAQQVGASVEASQGVTTGISAGDRANTLRTLAAEKSGPADLTMPGHIPPLVGLAGGVLVRLGRAEGALDLLRMAGMRACAAICEILGEEGEAATSEQLREFAQRHGLPLCTLESIVAHRLTHELLVERIAEVPFPVAGGELRGLVYRNFVDGREHLTLIKGELSARRPVLVRLHSECLTGDVFGSRRCDCGEQLQESLLRISNSEAGVLIYLHQEGRGIGLGNKIRAYALQDQGLDTVQANLELGFKEDLRDYGIGAQILRDLGVKRVMLLTNNPGKVEGLRGYGLEVTRVPLEAHPHSLNIDYLRTKQQKLGHLFSDLKVMPGKA
jgi:3,4-dihydroxy 2-butanone 4-phosphate synthase/GTP cyclohydrolase II